MIVFSGSKNILVEFNSITFPLKRCMFCPAAWALLDCSDVEEEASVFSWGMSLLPAILNVGTSQPDQLGL